MRAQRQLTHQGLSKAHAAIARQKAEAAIRQPRLIYCISDRISAAAATIVIAVCAPYNEYQYDDPDIILIK